MHSSFSSVSSQLPGLFGPLWLSQTVHAQSLSLGGTKLARGFTSCVRGANVYLLDSETPDIRAPDCHCLCGFNL